MLWRDVAAGGRTFREPLWEQQPACRHQLDQQRQQSSAPLATTVVRLRQMFSALSHESGLRVV